MLKDNLTLSKTLCATRRIPLFIVLFSENLLLNLCCVEIFPLETIKSVMEL